MTTVLPDNIGPYRLLRPIARGGMAEVYEVEDPASGEHLALKLLLQTGGALPRFNREYEAMIRLNHPNIVRVYHYGLFGDKPWLTMELLDGAPIQGYVKRCGRAGTPFRTGEVIRTAHDLALALDHIHSRGLVHRDLKSANVLVLPDGRVKLIDFGTAKVFDAVENITSEGEFIGTFAYASPEQLTQKGLDHRSDLYSLGVLLFRMATAKRPFNAKDLHALARQHVKEPPPRPRDRIPDLPQGLEDVILALLEKRPENRPQSGAEVAQALRDMTGADLLIPDQLTADLAVDSLVGREPQMTALWKLLDSAEEKALPPGHTTLLVGMQGSGRQHAITALEKDVGTREWRTLQWFFHRDGDPLDSLSNLLGELSRSFGDANPLAIKARRQLDRVRRLPSMAAAERIDQLVKTGAALFQLRATSDDKPVLVLLRSLHNAGPLGFEALVRLRNKLQQTQTRIQFIGDLLENHDGPDSIARNRLGDAQRISLPPLEVRQVALLVGSLLHRRPPPGGIARRIFDATGGLPTYVEEVVRGMVGGGLLRLQGRDPNRIEWAAQDDMEIPVPQGAQDRVLDQLCELPADRRRCLEVLALLDGEGSATHLAGALECGAADLLPALTDLADRGWIRLESRGGIPVARWRQILGTTVVLDRMHPTRRRVLERRLIEQVAGDPAFSAQIRLLLEVGRLDEAMERAVDWSTHHISGNRPQTALEVLDEVIPHLDFSPISPSEKAHLYLLHVTALLMSRPTDVQTSRSLAKATRYGRNEADAFEAELHLLRARIQRVIGHYPNFRKHLMEAWYLIEHAPPSALAAEVATLLGWSNRAAGAVDAAATWHGRARRIAVQSGDPSVRAHADVGVAGWQFARGQILESERTAASAMEVFERTGDVRGMSLAIPVWTHALVNQCRFSELMEVLNRVGPSIRHSEAPSAYVRMLLATAWAEVALCRLGRAQECVDELAAILRKGEHLDLRLESDLVWGRILLASGQYTDAHQRLMAVRNRAQNAGLQILAEWSHALVGEVLWAMGDQTAGADAMRKAVEALIRTGNLPVACDACCAQARAMGAFVDPDRIFAPVERWLEMQPVKGAQIERELARVRRAVFTRADHRIPLARASKMIAEVKKPLSPTEQAALNLHPWSRELRLVVKT